MPVLVTPEIIGSTAVIHLKGEIDSSNLSEMELVIKPLLADPALQTFLLHCKELVFIDSKVVGFLAYLSTTLAKSKRPLVMAALNETVNDILSLVGLNQIIPHYPTLEDALLLKTA